MNQETKTGVDDDVKLLHSMGYAQELARRMSGFSNFAISFSIICILAGCISAFQAGLSAGGGAAIGIGWPVGALFAVIVAAAMAQIASSYPTAGGLYHWSSTLGGKGYGWVTAWFNLLGLVFVVASVDFAVYDPFFKTLIAPMLGIDVSTWTWTHQTIFIGVLMASKAYLNQAGINITSKLTDLSGYLIFVVAVVLVASLLIYSPTTLDFSRLFTLTNFTGAEGSWWPQSNNTLTIFLSGMLLTVYTITGFDASAHTSKETHNASSNVPKGILKAVIYSGIFGYFMVCTFVLVMPDLSEGVKQGMGFFNALLSALPVWLKTVLGIGIFIVNYLCGLACVTSCSRMMYAFARDGGLPASNWLKSVSHKHRTPGPAIWVSVVLSFAATLYGSAFLVLSTGCAVFLYISYILPSAAGIFAEGKTWTHKGPFNLGAWSKPIATLAVLGGALLVYVGIQPPNEKVLYLALGMLGVMAIYWWAGGRNHFAGPPEGARIQERQLEISKIESTFKEA